MNCMAMIEKMKVSNKQIGTVVTQVMSTRPAAFHFTWRMPFVAPAPMMEASLTCPVETGQPRTEAIDKPKNAAKSVANP